MPLHQDCVVFAGWGDFTPIPESWTTKEEDMRKLTMLGVAAAMATGVALTSSPSQAITLGAPGAVNGAAETLNPVDKAACCMP